jgi:NitT/TauT family transport system ATP-binding protein
MPSALQAIISKSTRSKALAAACLTLGLSALAATASAAEKATVVLQYGISYLPLSVMQAQDYWQQRAKQAGIDLKVTWQNLGNGGALNDAILTGSADLAAGGFAPMMKLWDRTKNNIKVRGHAALNSSPVFLVTNRPDIKQLNDFKPDGKIALSIPKVSYQAVVLQMAAEKAFGPGEFGKLDAQTVSMKHPDAVAALASPRSPIAAYFGSSPFQEELLVEGRITLQGEPIGKPGPDRMMVFQEFDQLFPWRTVIQNVIFPMTARSWTPRERRRRARESLEKVGLAKFANAFPHELSGGMKQRAAIARAMAMEPEILLMDEPFAALDALTRRRLQDELLRLWHDLHFTMLFVTHSIEEATRNGSRILLLSPHPGQARGEFNCRPDWSNDQRQSIEQRITAMLLDSGPSDDGKHS